VTFIIYNFSCSCVLLFCSLMNYTALKVGTVLGILVYYLSAESWALISLMTRNKAVFTLDSCCQNLQIKYCLLNSRHVTIPSSRRTEAVAVGYVWRVRHDLLFV